MSFASAFDALEFLGYFSSFWLFIFSAAVRDRILDDWRSRSWLGRLLIPIEVSVSILCGVGPIALLAKVLLDWAALS